MREMYFSFLRAIPQEVLKFLSAPPKVLTPPGDGTDVLSTVSVSDQRQ